MGGSVEHAERGGVLGEDLVTLLEGPVGGSQCRVTGVRRWRPRVGTADPRLLRGAVWSDGRAGDNRGECEACSATTRDLRGGPGASAPASPHLRLRVGGRGDRPSIQLGSTAFATSVRTAVSQVPQPGVCVSTEDPATPLLSKSADGA